MDRALSETKRRRDMQEKYNLEHNITPKSVEKAVGELLAVSKSVEKAQGEKLTDQETKSKIKVLEMQMKAAAAELEFETAAKLRDEIFRLKSMHNA